MRLSIVVYQQDNDHYQRSKPPKFESLLSYPLHERNHTLPSLAFSPCFLVNFIRKPKYGISRSGCYRMGSEKSLKVFHLNRQHHYAKKQPETRDVPKGCLAIKVGQGEEQQRFVVPVMYFNHPLFMQLLKEAEEEYGFDQKGTITIPCHVEEFRNIRGLIDREKSLHHNHHIGCFGF